MKTTIILSGLLGLGFLGASAQIQYTDLNPDSTASASGSTFTSIDVNQDGISDFDFSISGGSPSLFGIGISTTDGEVVVNNKANLPNASFVAPLFTGVQINPGSKWATYQENIRLDDYTKQNFAGNGELFVGFRMKDGSDYNYGWMLVEVDNSITLSIKAYAMETTPNTPIEMGNTGTATIGLNDQKGRGFNIYPTLVSDELHIELSASAQRMAVYNLSGQLVWENTVNHSSRREVIDLNFLSEGIYLLAVISEDGTQTNRRFVRQN